MKATTQFAIKDGSAEKAPHSHYQAPEPPKKQGVFARSLSSYNVIRAKVTDEMRERPGATPEVGKKKKVEIGLS